MSLTLICVTIDLVRIGDVKDGGEERVGWSWGREERARSAKRALEEVKQLRHTSRVLAEPRTKALALSKDSSFGDEVCSAETGELR